MENRKSKKINSTENMGFFMLKQQEQKNDRPMLSVLHTPDKVVQEQLDITQESQQAML